MNTPHRHTPNPNTPNPNTPDPNTSNGPRSIARACSRRTRLALAAGVAGLALVAASCSGSISHSYRTFQSALDRGASCEELFDQRARFRNEETLSKIDRDLSEIGCATSESERTDR